ncbi:unnamed protein product [Prorocentrum cordatum]|uniref:Uncharacterized protein n=1 Tax=Prorocentrum cordatum TaxID=2364126 RepID=A0ABN9R6J8_9DINO|nr:unnamed protein product [Polarella glacialis]
MVSGAHEQSFSQLSAPAWEAYCRRHGIDFFLQEEALNSDYRFEWSKPRALLEILPRAPWKYAFLVDANSLPVKLGKHLEYMVKAHLRHKRHATDKASARLMFCPWDCDEEYSNHVEEGACHGPLLSGCILSVKKAGWEKTAELVRSWYVKRKEFRFEDPQALVHAFDQMKRRNSDKVYAGGFRGGGGGGGGARIKLPRHLHARW